MAATTRQTTYSKNTSRTTKTKKYRFPKNTGFPKKKGFPKIQVSQKIQVPKKYRFQMPKVTDPGLTGLTEPIKISLMDEPDILRNVSYTLESIVIIMSLLQ